MLTVPAASCTVSTMDIEYEVLKLIGKGELPHVVMQRLEISRSQYYGACEKLESQGALSKVGDLPVGAVSEICPPLGLTEFLNSVFQNSGMSEKELATARVLCSRYGWIQPPSYGTRYTRTRWTGQAVRRVDFKHNDTAFIVHGFLVPRNDKKAWDKAAPEHRLIHIESVALGCPISWRLERGRAVSADIIDSLVSASGRDAELTSAELYVNIALAVAWVNESRAVLARKVESKPHE